MSEPDLICILTLSEDFKTTSRVFILVSHTTFMLNSPFNDSSHGGLCALFGVYRAYRVYMVQPWFIGSPHR